MKEFIRSITKVTLAFVLIILLVGCRQVERNGSPSEPLTPTISPTLPTLTVEVEPTLPTSIEETTIDITTTTTEIETITTTETETDESTKEEPTLEESTEVIEETTVPESVDGTEPSTEEVFTFTELAKSMYVQNSVNIRNKPNVSGDIIFVLDRDAEVWVTGRCNETGWYRIDLEGQTFYVSDGYVADTRYVPPTTASQQTIAYTPRPTTATAGFVYYSVAGVWPNESYEEYLYNCLVDRGIAWWYPYAVAQIFQESRWNPNSTNGRDHGICQFKGESFTARAIHHANYPEADIWNPYDSLYVYSFYIRDVLAGVGWDITDALEFYITGTFGMNHDDYVSRVMGWYNQLGR